MKPSLALFEPWVNLIFEAVHCLAVHCILTQLVPSNISAHSACSAV